MQRLNDRLEGTPVTSTEDIGVDPEWVEAWAFAWLAEQTLAGLAGNVPAVTGAAGARSTARRATGGRHAAMDLRTARVGIAVVVAPGRAAAAVDLHGEWCCVAIEYIVVMSH